METVIVFGNPDDPDPEMQMNKEFIRIQTIQQVAELKELGYPIEPAEPPVIPLDQDIDLRIIEYKDGLKVPVFRKEYRDVPQLRVGELQIEVGDYVDVTDTAAPVKLTSA